eukprot:COSAG02_NODE_7111_length_3179_cov_2.701299_2_plen_57_part_00
MGTSANDELVPVYSAFTHTNSAIYALTPKYMLDKSYMVRSQRLGASRRNLLVLDSQ